MLRILDQRGEEELMYFVKNYYLKGVQDLRLFHHI